MNLTVEPLYLISIIVNLTVGFLMLFLYRGQNDRSAKYWFIASLALALSVGFILFRPYLPAVFSYSIAHTLSTASSILFGYSLILIGSQKARFPYALLLICVAYGFLLQYLVVSSAGRITPAFIAGAWSISLLAASWMSLRASRLLKNGYIELMTWLFLSSAILWVMRIPPLFAGFTESLGDPGAINTVTLIGIVVLGILRQLFYLVIRLSEMFKDLLRKQTIKIGETEEALLASLTTLASKRDNETGNHIVRTSKYVRVIAQQLQSMGHYAEFLTDVRIKDLYRAAPLHDIGKVGIPDAILNKPGKLSPEEWEVMKTHASIGESILVTVKERFSDLPSFLQHAIEIAGGHHERWDGTGYPHGLKGESIPLSARIMAVADVYDALVSRRIYKEPWTHEEACDELLKLSGSQFDPRIIDALVCEMDAFKLIYEAHKD
ncbi:HD-GYP domain-containing protein [Polynucleobacter sp. MG-27-Goln-C1]|uniref:HD-GYP domain-containing protein n=1 Tax=Polynucleobacter sp. MG-27-Goln-C1 TaxID=1819726 RepID=UPI001C0BA248|nr:HD domain-containing phosphohydrolase [Polynucleobacter sp. MG-27-Goln-C1]MBU3613268.1 HD domain-containing protein [Polynucleobacter sp. MG-27-Goln-C1]